MSRISDLRGRALWACGVSPMDTLPSSGNVPSLPGLGTRGLSSGSGVGQTGSAASDRLLLTWEVGVMTTLFLSWLVGEEHLQGPGDGGWHTARAPDSTFLLPDYCSHVTTRHSAVSYYGTALTTSTAIIASAAQDGPQLPADREPSGQDKPVHPCASAWPGQRAPVPGQGLTAHPPASRRAALRMLKDQRNRRAQRGSFLRRRQDSSGGNRGLPHQGPRSLMMAGPPSCLPPSPPLRPIRVRAPPTSPSAQGTRTYFSNEDGVQPCCSLCLLFPCLTGLLVSWANFNQTDRVRAFSAIVSELTPLQLTEAAPCPWPCMVAAGGSLCSRNL